MPGKIITLTLCTAIVATSAFAQKRDFKKERAGLARQEKEERREIHTNSPRLNYGANIVRVAPIAVMDIGVGFGLSYERIFGKEGNVGIVLPVNYIMEDRGGGFFTGEQNVSSNHSYIYFAPGLKIYPFGQRKVTYAVGPTLMLGYGGGKEWRGIYNNPNNPYSAELTDITKLRMAVLVNNYVNFQISPMFNLGLEAGFGARYIDHQTETNTSGKRVYNYGMKITGQAALTLGFRF